MTEKLYEMRKFRDFILMYDYYCYKGKPFRETCKIIITGAHYYEQKCTVFTLFGNCYFGLLREMMT